MYKRDPLNEPTDSPGCVSELKLPPILSVRDVANFLKVSTRFVYDAVASGAIPAKRVRGRIFFHRDTINRWLAGDRKSVV